MVKGVARHAVIVRSPDMKEFEQAIFILSGRGEPDQLESPAEMLDMACNLAARYRVGGVRRRRQTALGPLLAAFLLGCVATAGAWWAAAAFLMG